MSVYKYKSEKLTTKEEIRLWLDKYNIKNYIINDNLTVDVNGCVNLSSNGLIELPFKFQKVNGNFLVDWNNFKNIKNFPDIICGTLDLSWNYIPNFYFLGNCQFQKIKFIGNLKLILFLRKTNIHKFILKKVKKDFLMDYYDFCVIYNQTVIQKNKKLLNKKITKIPVSTVTKNIKIKKINL